MDWTDSMRSQLFTLHAEGLSLREIAARIGITKNAAVGASHRYGLPSRPSPIKTLADRPVLTSEERRERARRYERERSIRRRRDAGVQPKEPSQITPHRLRPVHRQITLAPPKPRAVRAAKFIPSARTCQSPLWGDTERPTHVYCGDPAEIGSYCKSCAARYFTRSWRGEGKREFTFGWPAGERRVGAEEGA